MSIVLLVIVLVCIVTVMILARKKSSSDSGLASEKDGCLYFIDAEERARHAEPNTGYSVHKVVEKHEFRYIETFYHAGSESAQAGDYEGAVDELSKSIAINPNYDIFNERGIIFSRMGKFKEAILDFSNAISLEPARADAYNNRGIVFVKKKKYDLAVRDLTSAIQISPDDPLLYSNRGGAYHEKGSYDLAKKDYSRAMELEGPELA